MLITSLKIYSPSKRAMMQNSPNHSRSSQILAGVASKPANVAFTSVQSLPPRIVEMIKGIDSLEGIQKGIDIFAPNGKPLSIRSIAVALHDTSILAARGCRNGCLYCHANSKIPLPESQIDFEDFTSLTAGMKTLLGRIGDKKLRSKFLPYTFKQGAALYFDTDPVFIRSLSKDGKEHSFVELNKMLHDATGVKGVFTTSGFNPEDAYPAQVAAEIVEAYAKDTTALAQLNVSLNPFHKDGLKAAMASREARKWLVKQGYKPDSKELITRLIQMPEPNRDKYAKRIANTLFNFTPMFDSPIFHVLIRAEMPSQLGGHNTPGSEKMRELFGFQTTKELICRVGSYLDEFYTKDMQSAAPRFVKSPEEKDRLLDRFRQLASNFNFAAGSSGRYRKLYKYVTGQEPPPVMKYLAKNIDINGRLYIDMSDEVNATDIRLNYMRPDRKTSPMGYIQKREVISSEALRDDETFALLMR